MPDLSLDSLRREAKLLQRAWIARDPQAVIRLKEHPPRGRQDLVRADFLHVIAQENGFASWPRLKLAAETMGLDRATALQRLKIALFHGRNALVEELLLQWPDLADGMFGLECALYRREAVAAALARNPALAVTEAGGRRPILHLAFSRWFQGRPGVAADMLAVAELLLAHGADVNDGFAMTPGEPHLLSALYGAVGHAGNMVLARWLLDHGADPNDGESLYHATELGHREGLRMLLEAGADPRGTNALLRAMDFHDHEAVALLLAHGAQADDFNDATVAGEAPVVVPALHQAARRGCDRRMAELVLKAGADPDRRHAGVTPYALARVFGSTAVAEAIADAGGSTELTREEALMARAAEGHDSPGAYIDPARLAPAYADLMRELVHLPGRLAQMKRLVDLGVPFDRPDPHEQVTPTHVAGWAGKAEVLKWLLTLRPDLSHVNGHGGTLLGAILHGAANNPDRAAGDYLGCLALALRQGVALPRREIALAPESLRDFLEDWAEARPGQVV